MRGGCFRPLSRSLARCWRWSIWAATTSPFATVRGWQAITAHFDWLVREAEVGARDAARHLRALKLKV
jgi:hypothetical protein